MAPKRDPAIGAGDVLEIDYVNHRGERALRKIVPEKIWWGTTEWHPKSQWLMRAYDVGKEAWRDFALKDINFRTEGTNDN